MPEVLREQAPQQGKEKRHYYRLEADLNAVYRLKGASDFFPARLANISIVGVYLCPSQLLRAGKLVELSFQLPGRDKNKIICLAKSVWSAEFNGYHTGLEFVKVKRMDQYKIASFIKAALTKRIKQIGLTAEEDEADTPTPQNF